MKEPRIVKMDWRPLGYWPVYKDGKRKWEKDVDDIDRSLKLKAVIEQAFKENEEVLNRLGSDYDADGVPYWEKYEERLRYMEENGI